MEVFRKLKVVHFSTQYSQVGGIEIYLQSLLAAQVAAGVEVELVTSCLGAVQPPIGVEVTELGDPTLLLGRYDYYPQLIRTSRAAAKRADLIHVHVPFATTSIAPLFASPTSRAVLSAYAHPNHFSSRRRRLQLAAVARRAATVVALSTGERDVLVESGVGTDRVQIVRSPGAVDLLALRSIRDSTNSLILSLGRLVGYKQHDVLVDACARAGLLEQLRIIGDGVRRDEIARRIESHGVDSTAVMLGSIPRDEVKDYLRRARLLVSLSTQESLGLVLIEALTAGVLTIASDIPPHRETLLSAGLADHLIPIGSDAFVVADHLERGYESDHAVKWIPPTWDDVAKDYLGIYGSILRPSDGYRHRR